MSSTSPKNRITVISAILLFLSIFIGTGLRSLWANFDLEGLPEPYRKQIQGVLEQAGGNREQLYQVLAAANSEGYLEVACFLISQMKENDLDALQADSQTLIEHIEEAYKAKELVPYSVPEGLFLDYVVNFRVLAEPVTPWRRELFRTFYPLVKNSSSIREAAVIINRWIAQNIEVISPQMVASPILEILKAGKGDREQVATLTVAALRSVAIPSRVVYGDCCGAQGSRDFWAEVHCQEGWVPLYPHEPESFGDFSVPEKRHPHSLAKVFAQRYLLKIDRTSEYVHPGRILVNVEGAHRPVSVAVHAFCSGSWLPIEEALADGHNPIQFGVGEGEYLLTAGSEGGKVLFQMLTVQPNETVRCRFDFFTDRSQLDE